MEGLELKLKRYHAALLSFLEEESKVTASVGKTERKVIADELRGQYLLLTNGWRDALHVDSMIYHFELKPDGKVWIHANWTDRLVDEDLLARGIAPADLVLGFLPESYREAALLAA